MSRISSSVGLITGIPIEETVNKLMAVAARPRELLANRSKALDSERLAVTKLTSLVLAFQFESNRLGSASLFSGKTITSSDATSLKAEGTTGGNPVAGSYQFRTLQTAAAQQLASNSLQSISDLSTSGSFQFGFGGFVDKGVELSELNDGAGVRTGTIRITDRAGNVAEVDLRAARNVDDVLRAINNNSTASISASVDGDRIVLVDSSGGAGNLKVQDIGSGKTALDLGLSGINVAANTATGSDIFRLHSDTMLATLNDGTGVPLTTGNDLAVTLADATTLQIDLGAAITLGDVLTAINAANPAKLAAAIAADGNRLVLTDLTTGSETFAVANVGAGTAADALGLTSVADGDTITGRRLVSGLRDTLVSSLRGGQGLGDTLGIVDITNRNNVTSNVDLTDAETLSEIIAAINDQAVGVTAAVNSARNGIVLNDTTGATASNLIVADGDANDTATALGLVINSAATSVNSGSLSRQQVGRATLLSTLNGGAGVDIGDILITDSTGAKAAIDLNTPGNEVETIGDVIDRINATAVADVEARLNETGDGILIVDNSGGLGTMKIEEVGTHTTARDLRLLGSAVEKVVDGIPKQVIDGTSSFSVDLSDLEDEAEEISLASLNNGEGVAQGVFLITDTDGNSAAVAVNSSITTVADLIEAINAKDIEVEARINEAGNGILLFDTADGAGTFKVEEIAGGTTAADLGFDTDVVTLEIDGDSHKAINGAGTFSQSVAESGLTALAAKINGLNAGVTASTVRDDSGFRLLLTVDKTGAGNELLIDGAAAGLSFDELEAARDAVIEFGGQTGGSGLVVTSSDGVFGGIVPGLTLTVLSASSQSIKVDVTKAQSQITGAIEDFVDAFNSIRTNLDEATTFDAETQTTGILFGTSAALRVESDLNHVLSGRFFGLGQFTSLESIGLSFTDKGKLQINRTKLDAALADDPSAVERLFTNKTLGVSARLKTAMDQLAGEDSVLELRAASLADVIKVNKDRVTFMDERLAHQRERLLANFAQLEATIAAMQQSLTALASLQIIPPLTSTSRN
jgi:flagellar hook-associated protein 2